jgi:hypothetical protein
MDTEETNTDGQARNMAGPSADAVGPAAIISNRLKIAIVRGDRIFICASS